MHGSRVSHDDADQEWKAGGQDVADLSAQVPVRTVTLYPGQTAHVALTITDAGALCRPTVTDGLWVKPPGLPAARVFSFVGGACPGKATLRIDAINPGVGIPFYTIR